MWINIFSLKDMKNLKNIVHPTLDDMVTAFSKADLTQRANSFNALRSADAPVSLAEDKLLTLTETKHLLKVSTSTIDRYVKCGRLDKIQIGGRYSKNLFRLSQIQSLIDSTLTTGGNN